mgnify:CR=1 FL=1
MKGEYNNSLFCGENMKNKKKEDLKYCFRYHCKGCPKERICSEKIKKELRKDKEK